MSTAASKFTFDTEFRGDGDVVSHRRPRAAEADPDAPRRSRRCAPRARAEGAKCRPGARRRERRPQTSPPWRSRCAPRWTRAMPRSRAVREEAARLALRRRRARSPPPPSPPCPPADVEAALREAMHQAIGEPRITLRAAPDVIAALEPQHRPTSPHEEGYDGRVVIAADPRSAAPTAASNGAAAAANAARRRSKPRSTR